MLFDPQVLVELPLQALATVAIIVQGKALAKVVMVLMSRYLVKTGEAGTAH